MTRRKGSVRRRVLGALGVVLMAGALSGAFVLPADQQGVVLRLGKVVRSVQEAGLYFKIPFMDTLVRYPKRLLEYDAAPVAVVTSDKKNLVFDSIAVFQIHDPDLFYRTIRTVEAAQQRLDDSVYAAVRIVAGKATFDDLIFNTRDQSLIEATVATNNQTKGYGVEVLRVAFKRVSLPEENEDAVYRSMVAERSRVAAQLRAEGRSEAARLRSEAQKKHTEILASAQRKAEEVKGRGDAQAQQLIADVAVEAPDLYLFLKTLDFYKNNLPGTPIILTPDSGVLRLLKGVPSAP